MDSGHDLRVASLESALDSVKTKIHHVRTSSIFVVVCACTHKHVSESACMCMNVSLCEFPQNVSYIDSSLHTYSLTLLSYFRGGMLS